MSRRRMRGCQSLNHSECYGDLWQCAQCGKTVCYAEGTTDDPDLCDDCWVQTHDPTLWREIERRRAIDTAAKMQALIEKLLYKHQCDVSAVGTQLWLALPNSRERLMIAGLSSQRVGLTHCVSDAEGQLSLDLDLIFVVCDMRFEPVELIHSTEIGYRYQQATGEDANNDEVNLAHFSEYLADLLEVQRWVVDGHRLPG